MWIFSQTQMLFNVETYNQTKQPNKRLNKHLPYITFLARLVSAVVLEIKTQAEKLMVWRAGYRKQFPSNSSVEV